VVCFLPSRRHEYLRPQLSLLQVESRLKVAMAERLAVERAAPLQALAPAATKKAQVVPIAPSSVVWAVLARKSGQK
jgi:hypothetical protein